MGMAELRVGVVGLGPIGLEVVRAILTRRELRLVAAVDVSPSLAGKPLGEIVPGAPSDVIVAASLDVTLLGTGVNPGFVMDRLPLQLAGACISVSRVRVDRVVDAAKRRGPLRKK